MPLVTFDRPISASQRRSATMTALLTSIDALIEPPIRLRGHHRGVRTPSCNIRVRVHTLNSRSQRAVEKLGAASVRSPMRKGAARTTCSDLKRRYIPRRAKPSKAKTGPGQNPE
jgi:hypothetical protein